MKLNDVMKNNGVVLRGITLMQDDSNISPTIYLNPVSYTHLASTLTAGALLGRFVSTAHNNFINYNDADYCVL